jgi:multidrug resistance efflux pump
MTPPIKQNEQLAIENIFGKPPGWIIYWGISIGFVFLLVCITISSFISYPDKLYLTGQIMAEARPIEIVSKMDGIIGGLYINDKQFVQNNTSLIAIRSTLSEQDLQSLFSFMNSFENISYIPNYLLLFEPENLQLGEVTSEYSLMIQSFKELENYLNDGSVFVKIKALEKEILHITQLNKSLSKQGDYYEKDVALTEKDYNRNLSLLEQGVIAPIEKEKSESKILTEKRHLEAFKSNVISNDVRIQQLRTQIADITAERKNGCNVRIFNISQQIAQIKGQIIAWDEKFNIKSPTAGQVSFSQNWSVNQYLKSGEVLFTIIPNSVNANYFVEGLLPVNSSGNLKVAQNAIVELENYPSNQFGVLKGEVIDIGLVPTEGNYRVKIKLSKNLITTYKKQIHHSQLLKVKVTINTKEYSLLERLFQNVLDISKNH